MFTGIIKYLGEIVDIQQEGSNYELWVKSEVTNQLQIDQSVAHNGVCLTIVEIKGDIYRVTAIDETMQKTNLGNLKTGELVNLELSMSFGTLVDGHMVYGHVDTTGICTNKEDKDGSTLFTFSFDEEHSTLVVEKGSVAINGISLTVWNVTNTSFTVAIIPYTIENTNLKNIEIGYKVNLEFDIFGKYVNKYLKKIDFKR